MNTIATTSSATPSTPNPKQPQQRQTAKEIIAANVKELIEQLEAGRSDALTTYLDAMSRFHNYSFGNILEIARQRPNATRVAGMWSWNQLGRRVKKGEKGIRILAPIIGIKRKPDAEAEKDITKQNTRVLVGFRNAYVFDVSQTEGAELPTMREMSGTVGENRDRLVSFIEEQGIELVFSEKIAPALGMSYGGRIAILPGQPEAEEFSTLVHELAHEMLHKAERRTTTTKVVRETVAAKPKLVQISTAYGQQQEGNPTLPRNKYVEIRPEKPTTKEEATRPEFKTCKYTTEAIVSDGIDKGELRKVCTESTCPVHHPKKQSSADDAKWKADQEKQRKDAAIANTTGIRILAAITAAVPVRLMKRDLLFVVERLASLLDENRLAVVARQHGIKKAKDSDSIGKLFAAYLRRAEESALGGLLVETTILHAATRQNAAEVLRDAASAYKVDVDAIGLKVKQEFAAKEKAKLTAKPPTKAVAKAQPTKKAKAA